MAPELAGSDAEADARADLYSLGCVAWFALTGRPVFVAESAKDLLRAQREQPAPALPATVNPGLARLVARLLAKNPHDRPASADELARDLRDLDLSLPTDPTLDDDATELAEDFRSRPTLIRTRRN
jgi:serine/threonine-protein kinase